MGHQKPLILVSWISLTWSLLSVKMGAKIARWAGFDGLQGAPTRGLPLRGTEMYLDEVHQILPIYFFEGTWAGPDAQWGDLDRIVFESPENAALRHLALEAFAARVKARQIVHQSRPGSLVEAHPGLWLTPSQVADRCAMDSSSIVWDTYHARRQSFFPNQLEEKPAGIDSSQMLSSWANWHSTLIYLGPYVKVIHFQPLRGSDELQFWLKGDPTELGAMLLEIQRLVDNQHYERLAYVVELPPPDGLVAKLIWLLKLPWLMRAVARKLRHDVS